MVQPTDLEMERQYKRKAFDGLLRIGRLRLTLDTRVTGVKVPSEHQGKTALTILFGLDLPISVDDMQVDENGIAVTLSFDRHPHHCVIPWDAVWYMIPDGEHEGILFSKLPESVRERIEKGKTVKPLDLDSYLEDRLCCKTEKSPSKPRFEVIDGEAGATDGSLTTEEKFDDDKVKSHQPSPLRLIQGGAEEADD